MLLSGCNEPDTDYCGLYSESFIGCNDGKSSGIMVDSGHDAVKSPINHPMRLIT